MASKVGKETSVWRLLWDGRRDGPGNMAVDEAILASHARGLVPPTLRFYRWQPPTISVGYAQQLAREIDLDACRRVGVGWVRRPTGGRAVLHDDEVTYSVVVVQRLFPGGVLETARILGEALARGLRHLGLEARLQHGREVGGSAACFDAPSWHEIVIEGRKVAGSAQTRKDGCILQHGSIPLSFDAERMAGLLNLGEGRRARVVAALSRSAAGLAAFLPVPPRFEEVGECFVRGMSEVLGIEFRQEGLTGEEEDLSARLRMEKYASPDWNRGTAQRRSSVRDDPRGPKEGLV